MKDSIIRLSLDVQDNNSLKTIQLKQGDTAKQLEITLADGGFPYELSSECYAVLTAEKPDGNTLYNGCEIIDGKIVYNCTEQTTAAVGKMTAELKVYGRDDQVLTSAFFRIVVNGTVFNDHAAESTSEFSALSALMTETAAALEDAANATQLAGDAARRADQAAENAQDSADTVVANTEDYIKQAADAAVNASSSSEAAARYADAAYAYQTAAVESASRAAASAEQAKTIADHLDAGVAANVAAANDAAAAAANYKTAAQQAAIAADSSSREAGQHAATAENARSAAAASAAAAQNTLDSAVNVIHQEGEYQVETITDVGQQKLNAIIAEGGAQIGAIGNAGGSQISAIIAEGNEQRDNVTKEGTRQIQDILRAGNDELSKVIGSSAAAEDAAEKAAKSATDADWSMQQASMSARSAGSSSIGAMEFAEAAKDSAAEAKRIKDSIPPDFTVLHNEVNRQKEDLIKCLDAVSTDEKVPFTYTGKYIATNGSIGSKVDITNFVEGAKYRLWVLPVKSGDVYTVAAKCFNAPRLWAFLDTEYTLLSHSEASANTISVPIELRADTDGYLIINVTTEAKYAVTRKVQIKSVDLVTAIEIKADKTQTDRIERSLNALWKVNQGQTYDFETVEESGMNDAPSGAKFMTPLEVYGKTEQESTNGYQLLTAIMQTGQSVDMFADGVWKSNVISGWNGMVIMCETVTLDTSSKTYYISCEARLVSGRAEKVNTINNSSVGGSVAVTQPILSSTFQRYEFELSKSTASIRNIFIQLTEATDVIYEVRNIMLSTTRNAPYEEKYTGGIPSPNPDYPQEIHSVEEIHVKRITADGSIVGERVITPPRPLNKIGEYADKADVENGVWEYAFDSYTFNGRETWSLLGTKSYGTTTLDYRIKTLPNSDVASIKCEIFKAATANSVWAGREPNSCSGYTGPNTNFRVFSEVINSQDDAREITNGKTVVFEIKDPESEPIDPEDLAFLRSIKLTPEDHHITVTDQDGNDVSYLLEYIVKLNEVN